jgi:hypothetical protein
MNIFNMFKKAKNIEPLPEFDRIKLDDIPSSSIILFYGGNKLTEMVGNNLYGHKYTPPAFHAAFYCENGLFLNVGKFRTIEELSSELRSSRRVDIIILKNLNSTQRLVGVRFAFLDSSKPKVGIELPDYSWTDYLRFGFKFLKPSKKDFCSENVVEIFQKIGVKVSDHLPVDTAPWNLLEYAISHPSECDIKTLFIGADFKH